MISLHCQSQTVLFVPKPIFSLIRFYQPVRRFDWFVQVRAIDLINGAQISRVAAAVARVRNEKKGRSTCQRRRRRRRFTAEKNVFSRVHGYDVINVKLTVTNGGCFKWLTPLLFYILFFLRQHRDFESFAIYGLDNSNETDTVIGSSETKGLILSWNCFG